jgi:hypothetical protein
LLLFAFLFSLCSLSFFNIYYSSISSFYFPYSSSFSRFSSFIWLMAHSCSRYYQ